MNNGSDVKYIPPKCLESECDIKSIVDLNPTLSVKKLIQKKQSKIYLNES